MVGVGHVFFHGSLGDTVGDDRAIGQGQGGEHVHRRYLDKVRAADVSFKVNFKVKP